VEPPAEALGALAATPRDRRVGGAGDADSGGRIGPPQSSIVTGLWVRRECDSTEQRLTSKNRVRVVEISPPAEAFVEHFDRLRRAGKPTGPDDYVIRNVRGGRNSRQRIATIVS